MLEIKVSTSPIAEKTIYALYNNCHSVFSTDNDDMGTEDIDTNLI